MTRLSVILFLLASLSAHQKPSDETSPSAAPEIPSLFTIQLEPRDPVGSVDDLIRLADLIIEGTVTNTLPAILIPGTSRVPIIETHSVISVSRVFHGVLAPGTQTVELTQIGGQYGEWTMIANDAPLVRAGETYIFFLISDPRVMPGDNSKLAHFAVSGVWSGLVKITEAAKIEFATAAMSTLHRNDDTDADIFATQLSDRIKELWTNVIVVNGPAWKGPGPRP